MKQHWAIFIDNNSDKTKLVRHLLKPTSELPKQLSFLQALKGGLFSKLALIQFMDSEDRHGIKLIAKDSEQSLRTMSSGEQKKALLKHLLASNPDFIVLDNPFDNLDQVTQQNLKRTLENQSQQTLYIQIISRQDDLLPFISNTAYFDKNAFTFQKDFERTFAEQQTLTFSATIPAPLQSIEFEQKTLIDLKGVTVKFGDKTVLQNIHWTIQRGEFWQLVGKNGSGKTTILSMITGENPKGYGQELFLFGQKKGTGESIWDIKKKIGYFTPSMTDKFTGYHSIENMLISGLNDSIGLYIRPTAAQLRLAKAWLVLLDLYDIKDTLFADLSMGQQRLIMTTRAMIKHPLLLILDEPTAGLDDASARLLVTLVNKIAKESATTIIFVSHRNEPGLTSDFIYELEMSEKGSVGRVHKPDLK